MLASRRSPLRFLLVMAAVVSAGSVSGTPDPVTPDGFRALMNEAVARMHAAMDVPYTGDADADFARMMIPHHQGAIDMALVELRYGKDQRLRRLAQEITGGTPSSMSAPVPVQVQVQMQVQQ